MNEQVKISGTISQPPEEILVKQEEFAYGFIMEVLTRGLYPDKLHVIREYVQNAYDAILELLRSGACTDAEDARIEIRVERPSIFIFDNGIGMDAKRIAEYRYVGHSRKLTRESVGFRGIGKLSGISAAKKIIVTTSQNGVPERHQLLFDAESMLQRVEELKARGDNIALNQLITEHTNLETFDEDPAAHYTSVELYNIRDDSQELMNEGKLAEYLSLTAPIDFDPTFEFGEQIDQWLRDYVEDYDTVPLHINGKQIYKPFLAEMKPPLQIMVWHGDSVNQDNDADSDDNGDLLAFCWFCEHKNKGQYPDKLRRGLLYRVKNFAVGTNQLPRITLWDYTPERAFYFFGEIHICDPDIVPSADRTDFEQNDARGRLYHRGNVEISKTLNRIAGKSSATKRATEFIRTGEQVVSAVSQSLERGKIPAELRVPKIIEVNRATEDVEKRLKDAPEEFKRRGKQVIEEGRTLIEQLDISTGDPHTSPTYDIRDILELGHEARWVYEMIIGVLKEEFGSRPDVFEKLITRVHARLQGSNSDGSG